MGATRWSDEHYVDRAKMRVTKGVDTFAYDKDIRSGKVETKAHDTLSPKNVKNRESRDSDIHPNSKAVAVLFDVTGSMSSVPQIVQKKLPQLMGLLLRKGYLDSPHILVGAIGDASPNPRPDKVPLQVGQFEAGIEIENDLTNIYLEGGGGGQLSESYELAMYFMARHTSIDCFEKRGEKGYLFIIGDEKSYSTVKKDEVKEIIGDSLQDDIDTVVILKELKERYEVFYILPNMTHHYNDEQIHRHWVNLLGQNVIKLEDPNGISELIASTIGMYEGKVSAEDIESDLCDIGTSKKLASTIGNALVPINKNGIVKKATGVDVDVKDTGVASGIATL